MSITLTNVRGCGAKSGGSGSRDSVAEKLCAVLAHKGTELVDLGSLRDYRNVSN